MSRKYQAMATNMEKLIAEADRALERVQDCAERVEAMTCGDAADGNKIAEGANSKVTAAKAHAMNARAALVMCKASATEAANMIPEVAVFLGGK